MEIKIKRSILLDAVQKTLGVVDKKTTMPILNHVLLKAEGGRLTVAATDREMSLISDYSADIVKEGKVTIPARKLYELAKESEGDEMTLERLENNNIKINAGKSKYKIAGLSADEYPSVAETKDVAYSQISGAALTNLINRTVYAVSDDQARPALGGVFLQTNEEAEGNVWSMVATDGHRLSMVRETTEEKGPVLGKGVIIPRKGLVEIKKMVAGQNVVEIGFLKNMLVVKVDSTVLKVNLVDSDFPDYKRVIPAGHPHKVALDRELFLHALKRMSVVSSGQYNSVVLRFSENLLHLESVNLDVGAADEEIDIDFTGENQAVGVNVNYLIEAVSAVPSKEFILEVDAGGLKPVLVRSAEGTGYLGLVMPLKLNEEEAKAA